ncbi:MAG: flavodoxin [Lachnospiraceae bacterium]|nr:flavodoxin [Lachnospiraceae bacterium]
MKTLVAFFSAEGTTAKIAGDLAASIGADIFEIKPLIPYTKKDITWTNPVSRCNREKFGKKDVPVSGKVEGFADYNTVLLGFPIWYACAPNVVNTFCKAYDWTGKKVLAFATSGGSGIGKTAEKLRPYTKGAASVDAKLVSSAAEVIRWAKL